MNPFYVSSFKRRGNILGKYRQCAVCKSNIVSTWTPLEYIYGSTISLSSSSFVQEIAYSFQMPIRLLRILCERKFKENSKAR